MGEKPFRKASWICSEEFSMVQPTNVYHKEMEKGESFSAGEYQNVHVVFRKKLSLPSLPQICQLRITADDYYKLYINGRYVCQGPAQGYYFAYNWNRIDIAPYLQEGENEIWVDVFYHGRINRAYNSGDGRMGMLAEAYEGEICLFYTDDTWEYARNTAYRSSHMIGYDTIYAEDYDSRVELAPWSPCRRKQADYTFCETPVKTLQVYEQQPVAQRHLVNGGIFYDFGQEVTATMHIIASGPAGKRIRILCGEEKEHSPEQVRWKMRCNCDCEEFWTLAGGRCELRQYDYKAFRYVTLVPDAGVTVEYMAAVVQHYPFDEGYCRLETADPILRDVWNICKNGVKYGAQEVFVDCPVREKGQYAGDLTVTSASHIVLTGDYSLLKKAIDNQMQSAVICKGLMAVTPGSYMQEIADYSLQFPILALRYYAHSKDKAYLERNLEVCEGILEHFATYAREDGLLETVTDKWNLVDWPQGCRDNYDFALTLPVAAGCHNVINAFYIGCMMQTEQIRRLLGIEKPVQSERLIQAFEKVFYCPETGLYVDAEGSGHSSLHANVLPLFYEFAVEESRERMISHILEKGLCCGTYFAWFLLKALCKNGHYVDAYRLIVSVGEHSWYNMVREGGTTCFEAWGKDQKVNTSLCHPWSSAPISVLAEDILPLHSEFGTIVYKN